jgi:hypothetical protein
MSQETPDRRRVVVAALAVVLLAGGAAVWKLSRPRGPTSAPLSDVEVERRRVAAFDPSFDPAKPGGGIAGVVKDAGGRAVVGAIVAATRQRGKDEAPAFTRPTPRIAVTGGDGRFAFADVLPGDYGLTATADAGAPARQGKVPVVSGKTSEVTLTLGPGGLLLIGEVTDIGGGAIAGAKALVRSIGVFLRPGDEPGVFQTTADDKGVFRVRLARGDYDVLVTADGYAPMRDRATLTSSEQHRRYRLNPAARLSGRVLDRKSREPAAGASVWLRLDRLESFVDREVAADGEGRFHFDDLPAGGYVVLARADRRIGLTRAVSLGVAQSTSDVEVLVDPGRSVRGLVVTQGDKPLGGVRVSVGRMDPPFERPVFAPRTGTDGTFTVEGLLPGKYRVNAWAEGQGPSKMETVQLASRDVQGLKLVMSQALVVRGQVLDRNGAPAAEVTVTGTVESPDPARRFSLDRATTDAAGKFQLDRLVPGKLTLTAKHADQGNARLGPEDTESMARNASLTLRLETWGAVSGTVKFPDGAPAAGVIVVAQPMGKMVFGPNDQAITDEGGRYRLGGLDKGQFMVTARRENVMNITAGMRQELTLEMGEQKTGVDLTVPAGGKRISGKVLGPDGKAASGAVVTLAAERGGFAFRMPLREGGPSVPQAISDADGAFTLEDLPEGQFTLWASDPTHADGEQKGVSAGATGVTVRLQGGASVAGVVRSRAGQPVSDYTITALPGGDRGASPNDRARNQMVARQWSPTAQVHDPEGTFSIARLAPGSYELTVTTTEGQGAVLPVTVAAGERKQGLTLLVEAGVKVVGKVLELDGGTPIAGATVEAMAATTRIEAQSLADGSFTLEGVPPGRARLEARPPGGFNNETHIAENTEIEARPGVPIIDVGTIKLLKGSYREKFGNQVGNRGMIGFSPAVLDGRPSVTAVRPGLPGEKAGLKHGDLLLKINGRSTEGMGNGALDFLAAGRVDQPLVLTVQSRDGAPREVTVTRAPIDYDPARPGAAPPPRSPTASATRPPSSK